MDESSEISFKMVDDDDINNGTTKTYWNDTNTKLFIAEFKKNYELWRTGKISRKKRMWEVVTGNVNAEGYVFTVEQVQNRYKTLRRRFKRTHFGLSTRSERSFPFQNELSDMFTINTRPAANYVSSFIREDSSNGEDEEGSQHDVETEEIQRSTPLKRNVTLRSSLGIQKRKQPKTNIEVLLEIKELIKKVEIRRQVRHEQNMKLAKERNDILQRKNALLEQIFLKHG